MRPPIETFKLECLIGEIEGDILLLDLAIDEALRQEVKDAVGSKQGYTTLVLNEDQMTALTHARGSAYRSVFALVKAFHGAEQLTFDRESPS